MNKKIRWGILSTAKIGTVKVIPAMQRCELGEVTAISSRDIETARKAARELNIPKAYGSYEAMLADPEIDAVYNPTPNHLHVPLSIAALRAGKHVLCEKPIALTTAEAQSLLDESKKHPKLKVMEAFMYRHHPQWVKAKQLVNEGAIGSVRTIHSFFSYFNNDPKNVRNQADIGGGGLMDIGCYNISLSRFIFDAEPQRVVSTVERDPQFGTDRIVSALMDFGSVGAEGRTATFTCSMQISGYQRVNIYGTQGRIEIEIPFNAPPDKPCKMWVQRGSAIEEIQFPVCDQYTIQGDLFAQAILNDTPVPTPLEDAVANMRVIERIFASADKRSWQ